MSKSKGQDAWMLKPKLEHHALSINSASVGNLINALCAGLLFKDTIPSTILLLGGVTLAGLIVWRLNLARSIRGASDDNVVALITLSRHVIASAVVLGGFWGGAVALMFAFGAPQHHLFAGIIGAGMMSAGTISYRTFGLGAQAYVWAFLPGAVYGLVATGLESAYAALGLLACFVVVLLSNARMTAQRFANAVQRERDLAKTHDMVQLLLNDFTEQGADWLIEVDHDGRIVKPSARLAEAARRPIETIENKFFMDLIDRDEAAVDLRTQFFSRQKIRQHIVSLTVDGEPRWWSITARPVAEVDISYRGVITDITAQRQAEEKVTYMAHYDGLTDLPNRFLFGDRLYHALNEDMGVAGLMFLDLDHFKSINDTLGHPVGDRLLKEVARRIESCVSGKELVARMGGDEFAILVPARRLAHIDRMASKIVEALRKPFPLGDHDVSIGTTIGIAVAPDHGKDPDLLIQNADLALYAAKAMGRNRAVRFEPGMDKAARDRRLIEMDLRGALAKGEMRLHYQPLINLETGETTGYEALIRWVHPTRGTVTPDAFIPIAEETGLIIQIGEWVIRQAVGDMTLWPDSVSVSVNLSPIQMRSPTLIATLVSAIARNQVDPGRICLEITESVLMQDSESNIETLYKLRDLGVQIALDDFGTGYSSLNYLRSFPFSKIKIDRCFVSEIDSREDCQAIIRSVVSLANSLGMATTAEGIEREEQIEHLRREGCGEVQGFFFSKAVPLEELTDLRQRQSRVSATLESFESRKKQAQRKLGQPSTPAPQAARRRA